MKRKRSASVGTSVNLKADAIAAQGIPQPSPYQRSTRGIRNQGGSSRNYRSNERRLKVVHSVRPLVLSRRFVRHPPA